MFITKFTSLIIFNMYICAVSYELLKLLVYTEGQFRTACLNLITLKGLVKQCYSTQITSSDKSTPSLATIEVDRLFLILEKAADTIISSHSCSPNPTWQIQRGLEQ